MGLKEELGLREGFKIIPHEALLNIYFTASVLKKEADRFFRRFGITDVQFNLLMLLAYQGGSGEGLTQMELSRMMLVNRANMTSLIDRMEKADLVERTHVQGDRRCYHIRLTPSGKKMLEEVEKSYHQKVRDIMAPLKKEELRSLMVLLQRIRSNVVI